MVLLKFIMKNKISIKKKFFKKPANSYLSYSLYGESKT